MVVLKPLARRDRRRGPDLLRDPRQRGQQRRRRRRPDRARSTRTGRGSACRLPASGRQAKPTSSTWSCTAPARRLGDQVEAAALGAALGTVRNDGQSPLLVGSAKTNVGHLEGAAGIVGLIKAVLCIKHRRDPRQPQLRARRSRDPAGSAGVASAAVAQACGRTPRGRCWPASARSAWAAPTATWYWPSRLCSTTSPGGRRRRRQPSRRLASRRLTDRRWG